MVSGVEPDSTLATTNTVRALSDDRCAANTDKVSGLAVEIARTLVSPNVDRAPS